MKTNSYDEAGLLERRPFSAEMDPEPNEEYSNETADNDLESDDELTDDEEIETEDDLDEVDDTETDAEKSELSGPQNDLIGQPDAAEEDEDLA